MTYTERSNGMIKDLAKKKSITFEEANELLLKNNYEASAHEKTMVSTPINCYLQVSTFT